MKQVNKWMYVLLILLLLISFLYITMTTREHNAELNKLRTALASYEGRESNYEKRLDDLRRERQDVIDSMVAAYKNNVDLQNDNKRLSSTVEELYLRNVSNLQLLFEESYTTRLSSEFDTNMQHWLIGYMDAILLEDAATHQQLFAADGMSEDDVLWQEREKVISFLIAEPASEQAVEQMLAETSLSNYDQAVQVFVLTDEYEVMTALFIIRQFGNEYRIIHL